MAKPLSPAAQAVLDALNMDELNGLQQVLARAHAVATLRVAAEQIADFQHTANPSKLGDTYDWGQRWIEGGISAAGSLLAVANELECEQ